MKFSNMVKLVVVTLCLSIVGCASSGEARKRANQKIDWNKMQQIDSIAYATGVRVIWVNPPQKKSSNK